MCIHVYVSDHVTQINSNKLEVQSSVKQISEPTMKTSIEMEVRNFMACLYNG